MSRLIIKTLLFVHYITIIPIMENWKPIKGYENFYSISDMGNVRRDVNGTGLCKKNRILKPGLKTGYYFVVLSKNGFQKCFRIAHLVIEHFLGPRPKTFDINHRNGIKTDNKINNLEYVSRSENIRHAFKNGLCPKRTKLTQTKIKEIRNCLKNGMEQKVIAKKYNCSQPTISCINRNTIWSYV